MRSADALTAFEEHLGSRDLAVDDLDGPSAINAMLTFYAEDRAEDVELDADSDMLLFQWGTRNWGSGPSFEYSITRQLITEPSDADDEGIWQLSLSFYFPPDAQNAQLGSGHRWHAAPGRIDEFASYIGAHPATAYTTAHQPAKTELQWEPV